MTPDTPVRRRAWLAALVAIGFMLGVALASPSSSDPVTAVTQQQALDALATAKAYVEAHPDAPPAPTFVLGTTEPTESNSGLAVEGLTTTDLTVVDGDLTIDNAWVTAHPDRVIDKVLVKGHVVFTAGQAVTITNSYIQGRTFTGSPPRTAIVYARSTSTPASARLNIRNSVITSVQPDVNLVSISGERVGELERNIIELGSDLVNVWDNVPYIKGNLIRRPVFWANDPKHANDGSHPGWSHNDGIQNNGSNGATIVGNSIDMHADPSFGDPGVLAAGGFPNLDWGGNVMLTGSNGRIENADVSSNWLHGGQVHIAMPYQSASNPYESGNSWSVHNNRHGLPHAYGTNQRQFVRWGWGKGPAVASVHDETLLDGTGLPAANLAGSATAASGQWIVRSNIS